MNTIFLQDRITATEAMIVAYETAITAVSTGGIESYTLDTGQTRQTVTKQNLVAMQKTLDSLYNRLVIFEARLSGNGVLIGRGAS